MHPCSQNWPRTCPPIRETPRSSVKASLSLQLRRRCPENSRLIHLFFPTSLHLQLNPNGSDKSTHLDLTRMLVSRVVCRGQNSQRQVGSPKADSVRRLRFTAHWIASWTSAEMPGSLLYDARLKEDEPSLIYTDNGIKQKSSGQLEYEV